MIKTQDSIHVSRPGQSRRQGGLQIKGIAHSIFVVERHVRCTPKWQPSCDSLIDLREPSQLLRIEVRLEERQSFCHTPTERDTILINREECGQRHVTANSRLGQEDNPRSHKLKKCPRILQWHGGNPFTSKKRQSVGKSTHSVSATHINLSTFRFRGQCNNPHPIQPSPRHQHQRNLVHERNLINNSED